jgi:hypothetical protein
MAKKRKQKEEEEVEIKLPEFDDEAFMKEETRAAWTSFIAIGYGLICGAISFGVFAITGGMWQLAMAVGGVLLFGVAGLFYLFKIDFHALNWKNYVGSGVFYILTWLIVFIILINPPFYDNQPPAIKRHTQYVEDSNGVYTSLNYTDGPVIPYGHNISVVVIIIDNGEVANINIEVKHDNTPVNADLIKVSSNKYNYSDFDYNRFHGYIYEYVLPSGSSTGMYAYVITVKDDSGHTSKADGSFDVEILR